MVGNFSIRLDHKGIQKKVDLIIPEDLETKKEFNNLMMMIRE